MNPFLALSPGSIAKQMRSASHRVIYAVPGIAESVALEILSALDPGVAVTVVIDPDAEICRLGFGDIEGMSALLNAGMPVRKAPGLRIGVLVIDEQAWAFAPTPLVVEELPTSSEPNAVSLNPSRIEVLVQAIVPAHDGEIKSTNMSVEAPSDTSTVKDMISAPDVQRSEPPFGPEVNQRIAEPMHSGHRRLPRGRATPGVFQGRNLRDAHRSRLQVAGRETFSFDRLEEAVPGRGRHQSRSCRGLI